MPLYNHTLTHSHTLLITCTCYDEIKGTQDQDFSYLFSDSLSLSCLTVLFACLSLPRSSYMLLPLWPSFYCSVCLSGPLSTVPSVYLRVERVSLAGLERYSADGVQH